MKLYELPPIWAEITRQIDEAEGEMSPEVEAQLDALELELEAKVRGICGLIRESLGEAEAIQEEIDRLGGLEHAATNNAARLKKYLLENFTRMGIDRVDAGIFKVSVCANGRPSIEWEGDMEPLPDCYRVVKESVNYQLAYEHLRASGVLPPGFTVTRGRHLRIR